MRLREVKKRASGLGARFSHSRVWRGKKERKKFQDTRVKDQESEKMVEDDLDVVKYKVYRIRVVVEKLVEGKSAIGACTMEVVGLVNP